MDSIRAILIFIYIYICILLGVTWRLWAQKTTSFDLFLVVLSLCEFSWRDRCFTGPPSRVYLWNILAGAGDPLYPMGNIINLAFMCLKKLRSSELVTHILWPKNREETEDGYTTTAPHGAFGSPGHGNPWISRRRSHPAMAPLHPSSATVFPSTSGLSGCLGGWFFVGAKERRCHV